MPLLGHGGLVAVMRPPLRQKGRSQSDRPFFRGRRPATILEALKHLADENADPDAVRQARAVVQDLCRKKIKDGLKDRYLVLSPALAEEGIYLLVFAVAAEVQQALAQKGFGDLARALSNERIIDAFVEIVKARDVELPMAFEERCRSLTWGAAQRLAQEAASDWPEVTERRVRIVRKRRGDD
jgi:hypothetical protein